MVDMLITGIILLVLGAAVVFRAEYHPNGNNGFFSLTDSGAMRGLWCIVVILVHVPAGYQNRIQDLAGSFAYIGVTFFFMTSAYGLSLKTARGGDVIRGFWRNRLPKLLVPSYLVNILFVVLFFLLLKKDVEPMQLIKIHGWVKWLLTCYVLFWAAHLVFRNRKAAAAALCGAVVLFSVIVYCLDRAGRIDSVTWCTEVYGFIWGTLLAMYYPEVKAFCQKNWVVKAIISCCVSGVLGVAYLKLKTVPFFGEYCLKIVLGAAILSFILILNARIRIGNKIIGFLGSISFEVYLSHGSVFLIVRTLFPALRSGMFILVSIALTVLIAAVLRSLGNWILKKVYKVRFFQVKG